MVLWSDEAPGRVEPALLGLAPDRRQKSGLADAGLACDQQQLASARGDVVEPAVDQIEQVVATDEERTADRADHSCHDPRV